MGTVDPVSEGVNDSDLQKKREVGQYRDIEGGQWGLATAGQLRLDLMGWNVILYPTTKYIIIVIQCNNSERHEN